MEVKQEFNEETCKIETEDNDLDDALLDGFKCEIKEESNIQSTPGTYDYLEEIPTNTEIHQDPNKLNPLEENQTSEKGDFKCEIKEESNSQSTHGTFDYLDLEIPTNTEIHQDRNKLNPFGENQQTEKGFTQEENKMKMKETFCEHSSRKQHYTKRRAKGKTGNKNIKVQTGQGPYKCEICLEQFSKPHQLKQHLITHSGEKLHKCEISFTKFSGANDLKRHLRVHTGEKPHKCEICLQQFSQVDCLKRHLRLHTGEKFYKCDICFKQFSQAGTLKTHLRVHTGKKPQFTSEVTITKIDFSA
uniref:Zinc finger protein 468-like n=1 Tax=Diabrotica virgifera virgifera TaxID=50390 RepID=A0A6P7F698_DIAVI